MQKIFRRFGFLLVFILSALVLCSCSECDIFGHSMTSHTVAPTCTEAGYQYSRCSYCGAETAHRPIAALGHKESFIWTTTRVATCAEEGERAKLCERCNAPVTTEVLSKPEHTPSGWTVIEPKTCYEDGERAKICTECNQHVQTEVLKAGHTVKILKATDATCTESGLTQGKMCTECEQILVAQEIIPALNHDYRSVAATSPTCSQYGYTEGVQCFNCKEWTSGHEQIDKIEHTVVIDAAVPATCTESGLSEGSHCSVCKEVFVKQNKTSPLGHSFSIYTNTCTRCPLKEYPEIRTKNEFMAYDGSYDAVIYLDYAMSLDEYLVQKILTSTSYIRLVGTKDVVYQLQLSINTERATPLRIDLVNAMLTTGPNYGAVIKSYGTKDNKAPLEIGLYGDKAGIFGQDGADGADGQEFDLKGKDGGDGGTAIVTTGDLTIYAYASHSEIHGGNGGNGGNGRDYWYKGGNGGNGGDGARAISASSITVVKAKTAPELIISGGKGGIGGTYGEGTKGDGTPGTDGKTYSTTDVPVLYK